MPRVESTGDSSMSAQVLRGIVDMAVPCVPDVALLRGAAWTQGSGHVVAGSGLVRSLRTSGGGACSMHAMFGKPDHSRALHLSNARSYMKKRNGNGL